MELALRIPRSPVGSDHYNNIRVMYKHSRSKDVLAKAKEICLVLNVPLFRTSKSRRRLKATTEYSAIPSSLLRFQRFSILFHTINPIAILVGHKSIFPLRNALSGVLGWGSLAKTVF